MMFASLFLKECKQILKCTTFYILIICIVLFYVTQLGNQTMIEKPVLGQKDYGTAVSMDETVIMNSTVQKLVLEYVQNNYVTYPVGFYKNVKLSKAKQKIMGKITAELTGLTVEELIKITEEALYNASSDIVLPTEVSPDITYEHFKELMKQADKLLGGGSKYSKTFLLSNAIVPRTYEDALKEHNDILKKDHVSGAYARLFCDYMGIVLAILPVFLAVTRGVRDKRARVSQVIYSKTESSFSIIMSRYLSMIAILALSVSLLTIPLMLKCSYYGYKTGVTADNFAFVKYACGWLLPSVMVSAAVGVFLTELTETAIAIAVQAVWWFASLFMGAARMEGGYGWNLIPRHNTLGNYQVYHDNFTVLFANRIIYSIFALLLIIGTAYVYDSKRKGKLIIRGKILSNRKSKSEA